MDPGLIGQAAGLFAVTNIDDIVILALFFAQGAGKPHTTRTIGAGQYLGFAGILAVAVAAAVGATFLPGRAIPLLGLLPLALGVKAAVQAWRRRHDDDDDDSPGGDGGPGVLTVAAVTFANGGDNIGVYVPVFATSGAAGMTVFVAVFLLLVAVWVAAGRFFATRPVVARALSRWGHVLLPVVLIGIGLLILAEGVR
ncbi:cadmium transporter [Actinoplanes philippinensis]|uniref:Cadmium resistance protein CadD, predicted permease n=1 Tax=Actinoplanes philippinensis TaxID=35752 RepID=A0A1I2HVU6_9ACTN|nr:cadmium resistance transporter [Actinoplanes philippinensis]GIE78927.1 cadmium transporter [Actinoplanes philippinensis]SFF34154.1 Cadmium resistance protein CadD, predicted permease [Actinoplanes philippinensis]